MSGRVEDKKLSRICFQFRLELSLMSNFMPVLVEFKTETENPSTREGSESKLLIPKLR